MGVVGDIRGYGYYLYTGGYRYSSDRRDNLEERALAILGLASTLA